MNNSRKLWKKIGAFFVCVSLVMTAVPGAIWVHASASTVSAQEAALLGTLSSAYESNGKPGAISSGSGDLGGKSYGTYQLASKFDIPKNFFSWCIQQTSQASYVDIGTQLQTAYTADNSTYDANFDRVWTALAQDGTVYGGDRGIFWQAQRDFIRMRYYDPIVSAIESSVPGFSMDNYSIALRNVFWSRSVQHGTGGAKEVITSAFNSLGGFANQDEATLIDAIYAESGAVGAPRTNVISSDIAIEFSISGSSLAYYSGNSSGVQVGVYQRLRIKEVADAQQMLANYGFTDAPVPQGIYTISLNGAQLTFRLNYFASGYYTLTTVNGSERRLAGSGSGTGVNLNSPAASDDQMWEIAASGSGYTLRCKATGSYLVLSGSSFSGGSTGSVWTLTPSASDWRLSGATYPTASSYLLQGCGFPIRGTLSSTFPISEVTISIINNSTGKQELDDPIPTRQPNARSFNLADLDSAVTISQLQPGSYTYQVDAYDTGSAADSHYQYTSVFHVVPDGHDTGTCNLIFNTAGGSCSTVYRRVTPGAAYGTLPTPEKTGYTFDGWYTSPVGGTAVTDSTVAPSAYNQMIYAHYTFSPASNISAYVTRLYQTCLDRTPDSGGLAAWSNSIATGGDTAASAGAYFFSCAEYLNCAHTDTQFVTALFSALLNRQPGASEISSWVGQLSSGVMTRSDVFASICASQEFNTLYTSYGITPGSITASAYDMGEDPTSVRAFVRRLYLTCLGRAPDADGMTNWTKNLRAGAITGAEAAAGFFTSKEYQNVDHTNQAFVTTLYNVLLGRAPAGTEANGWVSDITSGASTRAQVFDGFCGSQEFQKLCTAYGITAGRIDPSQYNMGEDLTEIHAFVTRLYKTCLSRDPDAAGLANWTSNLKAGAVTGAEAAAGFFASDEYLAKNPTVEQFVTTLYKVLLNRDPSADEVKNWSDTINDRTNTRAQVFDGFCGSQEFKGLCASYGITAGRIEPSDYDMGEIHAFVTRLYKICLSRDPDADGLKNWVSNLQSQAITGAQAAAGFFSSTELLNKKLSNEDYVKLLYTVLLNRQPGADEVKGWVSDITSGTSTRATVFDGFCGSQEFQGLCASYGITAGRIEPSQYNMG